MTDLNKQAAAWGDLDEQLAKDVAYIPLSYEKFFLMWGSGVKGWIDNPAFVGLPGPRVGRRQVTPWTVTG